MPARPAKVSTRTRRPDGELVVAIGATRSGKTAWVAQRVAAERRLLVWDSASEWFHKYRCAAVTNWRELATACLPCSPPRRLAVVVPVTQQNFAAFCRLAWVYVRAHGGALVVEELADVTHPGKAPPEWGEIVRKGLRYGPRVYGITQRPMESDKTIVGNASLIHVGRMVSPRDQAYMADWLSVPVEQVAALQPLEWIERDCRALKTTKGRLRLK